MYEGDTKENLKQHTSFAKKTKKTIKGHERIFFKPKKKTFSLNFTHKHIDTGM